VPDASTEFELLCDNKDLAALGPGYTLYFEFKKSMIYAFLGIGVLMAAVGTFLAHRSYNETKELEMWDNLPMFSRYCLLPFMFLEHDDFQRDMGIIAALNVIGIVAFMVYAFKIRKKLVELHDTLDSENITPSDYSLMVFNLPIDKSEDELKAIILERFKDLVTSANLEIVYINYTYNIEDFINATDKLSTLYKHRGLVKLYQKQYCKENNIDREAVKKDPDSIPPPPPVSGGICKKIELQMHKIEDDIIEMKDKVKNFEENLSVDTSINLYVGTAFVVF
jgi:hypothetical protein